MFSKIFGQCLKNIFNNCKNTCNKCYSSIDKEKLIIIILILLLLLLIVILITAPVRCYNTYEYCFLNYFNNSVSSKIACGLLTITVVIFYIFNLIMSSNLCVYLLNNDKINKEYQIQIFNTIIFILSIIFGSFLGLFLIDNDNKKNVNITDVSQKLDYFVSLILILVSYNIIIFMVSFLISFILFINYVINNIKKCFNEAKAEVKQEVQVQEILQII